MTPEELLKQGPEALDAIRTELAKRSLLEFTRQAWSILEPGTPMKSGWVMEAICEHVEAVFRGEIKRLVINVPPGSSKSRLVRVMAPLYLWTQKPWARIIGASYALSLSERDSYYARTIIQSDWYKNNFGVSISAEQGAKVNFDNDHMGGMRAISVGGATTGFRGDLLICFPAGEMVATERGEMPIDVVVEKADPSLRVWTFDPRKGEMVLETPSRWLKNPGDEIYEVGFSDGTTMRCTGDHKVLTADGWKAAALLVAGDTLPRLVKGRVVCSGYKSPLYVRRVGHADSTYCLTVERTGNFVCANTIVSNCDDAHNVSDGESDIKRNEAVQWFLETFQTRVNDLDNTPIIVIGQRIHQEDVYQAALDLGYEHLNIPMEWDESYRKTTSIGWTDPRTEEGELMWPERFSADAIERLKKAMGPYAAAAQLQQTPVPRKGGMFAVDNIQVIEELPDEPFIAVRAWDLAASQGAGAYTVGVLMYYGQKSDRFYIADVKRAQLGGGAVREMILSTAQEDGIGTKIILPQDPGQAGKVVVEDLIAMLTGYNARAEAQSGAKETRAEPLSAQIEIGRVSVLKRVWTRNWLDELRFFPKGKFKDQVDASASAFNALAPLTRQKAKKKPMLTVVGEKQVSWSRGVA